MKPPGRSKWTRRRYGECCSRDGLQAASWAEQSALRRVVMPEEHSASPSQQAETIWQDMTSGDAKRHNAALRVLFAASADVLAIIQQRSGEAATTCYGTTEGEAELADWRALDGESFHDDSGHYYTEQEEAEFCARQKQVREVTI